jgi:hypothetical protein
MNKQPQPGEWWRTRGGEILYVVGCRPKSDDTNWPLIVVDKHGVCVEPYTTGGFIDEPHIECEEDLVEHLPDCDSFEWVPVQYPRYFETHNREDYAFLRQDSATDFVLVQHDGTGREVTEVTLAERAEITEAEATSRIVPPAPEWPKYVTGRTGFACYTAYLRRDSETDCVLVTKSGMEHPNFWDATRDDLLLNGLWVYITEAEAKAFIKPTKPKARTITFCEHIVWDEPGCERLVWALEPDDLLYRHSYPTGQTRTVEVPE